MNAKSSLIKLYLGRGVLAVAWAAAFASAHDPIDALTITLLVAYPLIDAVSSLIDLRTLPSGPERSLTAFNGVLSTLAAAGVGLAGAGGVRRCCTCSVPGPSSRARRRCWSGGGGAAPSWAGSGRC